VDTVGVRFRLGGVGPFVAGPLRDVTGQTPAASAVFGAAAGRLESALRAASDVEARALVLDAFFRARIREHGPAASFEAALRVLVESDGGASVASVAAAAGVSVRQVERLFTRHLGIPPKAVGRVLRFQRALRSLMREPNGTLAEVALDAGYFDQAHFIRDFRAMTGGVPRGYRGYYPPDGPRDFAPNVVVFVQDEA
jgi:AraC-like DNA-binding protein